MSAGDYILAAAVAIVLFAIVFLGPGLFAIIMQRLFAKTRVPMSNMVVALICALMDFTLRLTNAAKYHAAFSSAFADNGVAGDRISWIIFMTLLILFYYMLVRLGKAFFRAVGLRIGDKSITTKDCQHVPPEDARSGRF